MVGVFPEPIPVDDTIIQLKENFWNSPEVEEIVSPVEEPGTHRVCPKPGVSIFREDTSEPNDKVQNLSQENVQNVLNETLDLSNENAQGSDEELDLDNDGWDLLMNAIAMYFFCGITKTTN